jgi:hypothetical protein
MWNESPWGGRAESKKRPAYELARKIRQQFAAKKFKLRRYQKGGSHKKQSASCQNCRTPMAESSL